MKKVLLLLSGLILLSSCGPGTNNSGSATANVSKNNTSLNSQNSSIDDQNISKVVSTFNPMWSRQVGEKISSIANASSTDTYGNTYVAGSTINPISGTIQSGIEDYFLARYDNATGNLLWIRQVGEGGGVTVAKGVSADSKGYIYVAGYTSMGISGQKQSGKNDYFIAQYTIDGDLIWSKQVGFTNGNSYATAVKVDVLNNVIYVSGYTDSGISGGKQTGRYDYFIAKYNATGSLIWSKQVGSSGGTTEANGVTVDSHGNAYIAGFTNIGISDQIQNGMDDYFIAQYDSSGNMKWTKQVGAIGGKTGAYGIAADGTDAASIYVVGGTTQGILNQPQSGNEDYFIVQYNMSGNVMWAKQVGAFKGTSQANGVSTDTKGNVYLAGGTDRALSNAVQNGLQDYFVIKYDNLGNLKYTRQFGQYNNYTEANAVSNDNVHFMVSGFTTIGPSDQSVDKDYFVAEHSMLTSKAIGYREGKVGGMTTGNGICADKLGYIYVTGSTNGGISGQLQQGKSDYFLTKYDTSSNLIWSKQVGVTDGQTYGQSVATDNKGNIYVTGYSNKGVSGQSQNGSYDYFIAKYGSDGSLVWSRQVGSSGGYTLGYGTSIDSYGNVYVTGYTTVGISGQSQNGVWDYFVAKYDNAGDLIWSRQVGNTGGTTRGNGIVADLYGNVYVTGYTTVGISGQSQSGDLDYFIAKYDNNGNMVWTKQVGGTSQNGYYHGHTVGQSVSTDNSNYVYLTGYTDIDLITQQFISSNQYFIAKYNEDGNLQWTKQGSGQSQGNSIAVNNLSNIYVVGMISSTSPDQTGIFDYFITKYDLNGNQIWFNQIGAVNGNSIGYGVSADNNGYVYLTGITDMGLSGQAQNGYQDYFIAKYIN